MNAMSATQWAPAPEWADEVDVDMPDADGQARYITGMAEGFVTADGVVRLAMQRQEDRALDGTITNTDTINVDGRGLTLDQARLFARQILRDVDRFDGIPSPRGAARLTGTKHVEYGSTVA